MKAKMFVKKDEDGMPEEIGIVVLTKVSKPLRLVAMFAFVFVTTTISELGK